MNPSDTPANFGASNGAVFGRRDCCCKATVFQPVMRCKIPESYSENHFGGLGRRFYDTECPQHLSGVADMPDQ